MTLKLEKELLEDHQAKLVVTVEPERVTRAMQAAAGRISKKVDVPGFRRGKAPYQIIARYFGEEAIFEEALEPLGQSIYVEALEQSELEPYGPGSLDDVQRDPLVLAFTVPLAPEVDLGEYRSVRNPYKARLVTDMDVDHALEHLRDDQATLEPVDRAVVMGDVATLDILGTTAPEGARKRKAKQPAETSEGSSADTADTFIDRSDVRVLITKDATFPVPGFPAKVVGMNAGEKIEFDIKLPKNDTVAEEVRGKTIHFTVTCKEVHKRDVPALDDEFAKSVGEFENLQALRDRLRQQLEREFETSTRDEYLDGIFSKLTGGVVKVNYPPSMLDDQIDDMLNDFDRQLKRQNMNLDEYIKLNQTTREAVREDFRESARNQLVRGLILGKLSEAEKIKVGNDEVEDEIKTQMLSFGAQAPMIDQLMRTPEAKRSIASRLLTEKTLNRLVEIARGQAPDLDSLESGEAAPEGKPAKGKKAKRTGATAEKAVLTTKKTRKTGKVSDGKSTEPAAE